jgi:hypothetical protein
VRLLLACVLGATTLAACGNPSSQEPATAPSVAATASVAQSAAAVPQALALSAPRVGGGTINLADYAGKPVLLWFWAPT